ncbi:hypothetical protein Ssi03_70060 [Sphaerisporangium siamense]|uniref:Putative RNA methylase n=1 Tax=Sphaerisporangium siamense TaxID=795645 RepID=A0A7W7DAE3_9ACTN|nr:class I SAM-dependent methyltransferase [Sphaerisporangium siamense]MBB4702350.1 putative RNA methylase [Sphaerisporangium siamense]GII89016.1 hypothetical protein Ssi03_70060 [Sphaerisporangium siamense]
MVELDPGNTAITEEAVRVAGLSQVEVITADAALTDYYRDMVPADVVLVRGLFGNISDEDIEHTVDTCRQLCRTGGVVIWTRHLERPCPCWSCREFSRQRARQPQADLD